MKTKKKYKNINNLFLKRDCGSAQPSILKLNLGDFCIEKN